MYARKYIYIYMYKCIIPSNRAHEFNRMRHFSKNPNFQADEASVSSMLNRAARTLRRRARREPSSLTFCRLAPCVSDRPSKLHLT